MSQPPQKEPVSRVPGSVPNIPPNFNYPANQNNQLQIQKEAGERKILVIYSIGLVVGILAVGLVAGVLDTAIRNRKDNYFFLNAEDMLMVIASIAPWAVLFFLIAMAWSFVANWLFVKWNTALASDEQDEAYGKGIIYEIVKDNNSAAALLLLMPLMIIALALIFIVILIK